jgi:chemotaxis protein MotB
MALSRRQRANQDIWPGFVDALASLLMVIIFLLMIFVVSQLFLNEELIGRDRALERLQGRVSELADMLALEREEAAELRTSLESANERLRASLERQDALEETIFQLRGENASLASELDAARAQNEDLASRLTLSEEATADAQGRIAELEGELEESRERIAGLERTRAEVSAELEDAYKTIEADRETIEAQLGELQRLEDEIEALLALRDELQGRLAEEALALDESEQELVQARAEASLLSDRIEELNAQIRQLNSLLETYEERDEAQKAQIVDLGRRLNVALASKVQELASYRSEFFGKLREVLGAREDIRIVGDRFVFQSEVLFEKGAAELGPAGQLQLIKLADTLKEISAEIPDEIDWILQINGHTDRDPINTPRFPSNWELSTARAISVLKFLRDEGIDPARMSAAGFAQYQPLDEGNSPEALRRNRRIELKFTNR